MASQRPPETTSSVEYPELGQTRKPQVPAKQLNSDYPLIDSDPHFKRVLSYSRPGDWAYGGGLTALGPATLLWMEKMAPSEVSKPGFASAMRLTGALSLTAGFLMMYSRSQNRFYGFTENRREMDMDMREMTDRVKQGKPLYGHSDLTDYMQGVASRQSRYSGVFLHVMPWFNLVNHNQHGVDTAKYYQNAERELEAEREGKIQ